MKANAVIQKLGSALLISVALLTQLSLTQAQAGERQDTLQKPSTAESLNVIVVLDKNYAPGRGLENRAEAASIARGMGVSAKHTFGSALFGFSANIPQSRLSRLQNDPRVAYIELDELNSIPTPPDRAQQPRRCTNDPTGPGCDGDSGDTGSTPSEEVPWGIERIGAASNSNTGSGVHVYIIDSGIDGDHEDLAANLGNGFAAVNCASKGKNNSCLNLWDDDNGHGTHVAGTVGAVDNDLGVIGVAPGVTLHAVKVLNNRGSGFSSEIIAGIDWVASEVEARGAAAIANMSIGGSGSKTGTCDSTGFSGSNAYQQAMCNAAHKGVVFVVAAGNEDVDAANSRPASYDDTSIAVSAIGQVVDADGVLTGEYGWPSWSNWGNDSAPWTNDNSAPVAIAAPGMGILSTWKGGKYDTSNGTSMASPHVAGALSLFLNSNAQSADYSALVNTRAALLATEEPTDTYLFTIRSSNPHDEDFLNATSF